MLQLLLQPTEQPLLHQLQLHPQEALQQPLLLHLLEDLLPLLLLQPHLETVQLLPVPRLQLAGLLLLLLQLHPQEEEEEGGALQLLQALHPQEEEEEEVALQLLQALHPQEEEETEEETEEEVALQLLQALHPQEEEGTEEEVAPQLLLAECHLYSMIVYAFSSTEFVSVQQPQRLSELF